MSEIREMNLQRAGTDIVRAAFTVEFSNSDLVSMNIAVATTPSTSIPELQRLAIRSAIEQLSRFIEEPIATGG